MLAFGQGQITANYPQQAHVRTWMVAQATPGNQGSDAGLQYTKELLMNEIRKLVKSNDCKTALEKLEKFLTTFPDDREAQNLKTFVHKECRKALQGLLRLQVEPVGAVVSELQEGNRLAELGKVPESGVFEADVYPEQFGRPITLVVGKPGWASKTLRAVTLSKERPTHDFGMIQLQPLVAALEIETNVPDVTVTLQGPAGPVEVNTGPMKKVTVNEISTGVPYQLTFTKQGYETLSPAPVTIPPDFAGKTATTGLITLTPVGGGTAEPSAGVPELNEKAIQAAKDGKFDQVQSLIEQGAGVNSKDEDDATLLAWACDAGNNKVVSFLIERGADVNAKDTNGTSPIHWAAKNGNVEVLRLLVEKGVGVDDKDKEGSTPLMWAAAEGHADAVEFLLNEGADPNVAVDLKQPENEGKKVRAKMTALIAAAHAGNAKIVELLIDKGADVDVKGDRGRTALYEAAERGYADVVQILVDKGADGEIATRDDWTPLVAAADNGHGDVVDILVKAGATSQQELAGKVAKMRGHKDIADSLK